MRTKSRFVNSLEYVIPHMEPSKLEYGPLHSEQFGVMKFSMKSIITTSFGEQRKRRKLFYVLRLISESNISSVDSTLCVNWKAVPHKQNILVRPENCLLNWSNTFLYLFIMILWTFGQTTIILGMQFQAWPWSMSKDWLLKLHTPHSTLPQIWGIQENLASNVFYWPWKLKTDFGN